MESTFYFLSINDENGYNVVEHVANYSNDTVHVSEWHVYNLPSSEYRKSHHLTNWVKQNKPNWTIVEKQIPYNSLV
jgi:hypothetical protein